MLTIALGTDLCGRLFSIFSAWLELGPYRYFHISSLRPKKLNKILGEDLRV